MTDSVQSIPYTRARFRVTVPDHFAGCQFPKFSMRCPWGDVASLGLVMRDMSSVDFSKEDVGVSAHGVELE